MLTHKKEGAGRGGGGGEKGEERVMHSPSSLGI